MKPIVKYKKNISKGVRTHKRAVRNLIRFYWKRHVDKFKRYSIVSYVTMCYVFNAAKKLKLRCEHALNIYMPKIGI